MAQEGLGLAVGGNDAGACPSIGLPKRALQPRLFGEYVGTPPVGAAWLQRAGRSPRCDTEERWLISGRGGHVSIATEPLAIDTLGDPCLSHCCKQDAASSKRGRSLTFRHAFA